MSQVSKYVLPVFDRKHRSRVWRYKCSLCNRCRHSDPQVVRQHIRNEHAQLFVQGNPPLPLLQSVRNLSAVAETVQNTPASFPPSMLVFFGFFILFHTLCTNIPIDLHLPILQSSHPLHVHTQSYGNVEVLQRVLIILHMSGVFP